MTPVPTCQNCAQEHGSEDACLVGLLIGVVRDRIGHLSDEDIAAIHREIDIDYLWEEFGGPATDYVESLVRAHRRIDEKEE